MKHAREDLTAYYAEAGSWAADERDAMRRSRRIAWIVGLVAVTVAVCEAFALMLLTPLKTVVPYTLMVDRQTGFVQLLKPLEPQRISGDTALTQSFLVQYVIAREGFDIAGLETDYRKVALWSGGPARADYLARMQVSNPDSPLVRYPRSTIIETRVKSVTAVGDTRALVRFETRRRDAGGALGAVNAWIALIDYRFSGEPMSVEDRFVNPLGFQVLRYRRSAEAPPAEPEPAVVATPSAQPPSVLIQPRLRTVPAYPRATPQPPVEL